MKKHWGLWVIGVALLVPALVALAGYVVMSLWNALLPELFGWRLVTFWQALGLLLLARILFGRWHGGHGRHGHWRRHVRERWEELTPEEREKLRQGLRSHCGHSEPPATGSVA